MSQSPTESGESLANYGLGWQSVNKLIRQGFSWSGHERNVAFLNTRGGRFADVSAASGLGLADDGRAAASVDWDFDGDLDFFVTNRTGPRVRFLRNDARGAGGFLLLRLEGRTGNRDAVGARVELHLQGGSVERLVQTRRAGEGFLAQSSAWLHFGLGAAEIERVVVRWPRGAEESFAGLSRDRRYRLIEGSGDAVEWTPPADPGDLRSSTPAPPRASAAARIVLPEPVPIPELHVESSDGRVGTLFGVRPAGTTRADRPLLLNLWASWCAPCAVELAEFTESAGTLRTAGLEVLALSLDEPANRDAAMDLLERLDWPFPSGFATQEAIEVLDVLQGAILNRETRIPVPTSFLIDGHGNLVALYLGRVEPERVLQDLFLLGADARARLDAAVPFPGRWYQAQPGVDLAYFERIFRKRGLPLAAREYELGQVQFRPSSKAEMHHQFGRSLLEQGRPIDAVNHFRQAIEEDPFYFDAHQGLGLALHVQQKFDEAATAYEIALELDPEHENTLFNLGLARLALGDRDAAWRVVDPLRKLGSRHAADLEARLRQAEGG